MLSAVSDSQLNAIAKLKQARQAKSNADASARMALQVAEERQQQAEAAEQAAATAFDTAVTARQTQYSRTADLESEKEEVEKALWQAQKKVRGLEGQQQRYDEWKAAKRREEALKAQQAALAAAGNSGGGGGGGVPSGSSAPAGASVEAVVSRAMSQIGMPYAWGGGNQSGPTYGIRDGGVADSYGDYAKIGFDCSGLMIYAFAGVKGLPHYSGYQYTSGRHVPLSQARRGDMLFWGNGGIHHVALYLGNGQMIEAPQSGMYVRVTSGAVRRHPAVRHPPDRLTARAGADVHALALRAEQAEHLGRARRRGCRSQCGMRVSNSATSPGREHEVVLAEQQPQPAGQHVQPLVALVASAARAPSAGQPGGIDHLVRLQPAGPPGQRRHRHAVALDGRGCTRGSPVGGASTSSSSGTWWARASGSSSSSVGRRWPDSSRDSVLTEMPVVVRQLAPASRRAAAAAPAAAAPTAASTSSQVASSCTVCHTGNRTCQVGQRGRTVGGRYPDEQGSDRCETHTTWWWSAAARPG